MRPCYRRWAWHLHTSSVSLGTLKVQNTSSSNVHCRKCSPFIAASSTSMSHLCGAVYVGALLCPYLTQMSARAQPDMPNVRPRNQEHSRPSANLTTKDGKLCSTVMVTFSAIR